MLRPKQQPVHYRIAGDPYTINCFATNDFQSPKHLRVSWFKESTRISTGHHWTISHHRSMGTISSVMFIIELNVNQHNGTYTCSVYNYMISTAVNQSTTLIVESMYVFVCYLCN